MNMDRNLDLYFKFRVTPKVKRSMIIKCLTRRKIPFNIIKYLILEFYEKYLPEYNLKKCLLPKANVTLKIQYKLIFKNSKIKIIMNNTVGEDEFLDYMEAYDFYDGMSIYNKGNNKYSIAY